MSRRVASHAAHAALFYESATACQAAAARVGDAEHDQEITLPDSAINALRSAGG
jgi:hypothetical protein